MAVLHHGLYNFTVFYISPLSIVLVLEYYLWCNFISKNKEESKQNILVSDFRKMFARQISKGQLHRRRLQNKVRKNLKLGAQR